MLLLGTCVSQGKLTFITIWNLLNVLWLVFYLGEDSATKAVSSNDSVVLYGHWTFDLY